VTLCCHCFLGPRTCWRKGGGVSCILFFQSQHGPGKNRVHIGPHSPNNCGGKPCIAKMETVRVPGGPYGRSCWHCTWAMCFCSWSGFHANDGCEVLPNQRRGGGLHRMTHYDVQRDGRHERKGGLNKSVLCMKGGIALSLLLSETCTPYGWLQHALMCCIDAHCVKRPRGGSRGVGNGKMERL